MKISLADNLTLKWKKKKETAILWLKRRKNYKRNNAHFYIHKLRVQKNRNNIHQKKKKQFRSLTYVDKENSLWLHKRRAKKVKKNTPVYVHLTWNLLKTHSEKCAHRKMYSCTHTHMCPNKRIHTFIHM